MKVVWTRSAQRALEQIFEYIALDNPHAAGDVVDAIIAAADRLKHLPYRHRERAGRLRHMLVQGTPYFIRYKIKQGSDGGLVISIITVRHGARNG